MADRLSFRLVESEQDVVELEKLAAKVHFDMGVHDRLIQWRYSPKTFVLVLDKETKKNCGLRDSKLRAGRHFHARTCLHRKGVPNQTHFGRSYTHIGQDNIS